MGKKKKQIEKIKRIRKENKNTFFVLLLMFFLLILISIFLLLFSQRLPGDFYEGSSVPNFCTEKCGVYDYLSSLNNSKYSVIQCECITGIEKGEGKIFPVVRPKTVTYYFDSQTLIKITKQDVIDRIKDGTKN